jgi:hypothetical protein
MNGLSKELLTQIHGGVGILKPDIAFEGLDWFSIGKVELGHALNDYSPVSPYFPIFHAVFAHVLISESAIAQ